MTAEELVVAIRVTAENSEETVKAIREEVEKLGISADDIKVKGGDTFKPMTQSANEAAAAQAALAAAATAAFTQIVGAVERGTQAYNAYTAATKGLESVASGRGVDQSALSEALESVTDEFFSATAAASAYKNLLSRGYSLDQATNTINRLKDAAAFGRAANLTLEDAVVSATEGIRNENSILVDNAGVTKNVAKMWEDYAKSIGVSTTSLTQAQKVEAEYLGIMAETAMQVGDLQKASDTLAGAQAENAAQATKAATAYGEAMAPAVQAVTEAGTTLMEIVTGLLEMFPEAASGATTAAVAFTGLVAAMKGFEAVKSITAALSLTSATVAPLAAVAAVVGLVAAAYTAYTNAQNEAAKAEEEAQAEKEKLRQQELGQLKSVTTELGELRGQYVLSGGSLDDLAGTYDSGNDAIVDRIRLLEAEQRALLEKQKAETEALLAEKQAEAERKQTAAQGLAQELKVNPINFDVDSGWVPSPSGLEIDNNVWQEELDRWVLSMKNELPEVQELAVQLHDALWNAGSAEEARTIYADFLTSFSEGLNQTSEEAASLQETLDGINEGLENSEGFNFDKTFGGAYKGTGEAAKSTEELTGALGEAKKQYDELGKEIAGVYKELNNTKALKDQVSGYKDIVKQTKEAGKGWVDLSDDVKGFAKQLGVADGDIDGLEAALESMEGQLDSSMGSSMAQLQSLHGELAALQMQILSIPEAELTGDPTPLLKAIAAAMAALDPLLAQMAEAGIVPETATKSRGGGGGSSKSESTSDPEREAEEAYREQIELIEHKRHMDQITAQEEIRLLEKVKREYAKTGDSIMDVDERIYDARQELREEEAEKITSVYDSITEALEERYEEQREIEQKRIEDSIAAWEKWSDDTCAAIQAQIDALDEQEQAEEREAQRAEQLRKIDKLETQLTYETDDYNQSQLRRQIEEAQKEWEKVQAEWAREDQRDALEAEMEAIEKRAEEEIGKLEAESERIDSVYDQMTEAASLAAEAQKMLMESSQGEILDLLASYAPDYEATGRSWGEKLYEGFAAAFGDITKYFESLDSQFEQMVEKAQQAAFGKTQSAAGGSTASVTNAPTINQTVNFNQPIESPADVAERMQEVSEALAGQI